MANYKYPFKDKAGKDVVDADVYYSALGMASGGYYVFGPSGVHSGIHYESAMANLLSLDEGIGAMTKGEVVAYRINREYPTSPGAAKVPTTAESTSAAFSTGFVLTRHTLEYPTGNKLTYFCLAMHLRSFGDYERMGSVVKRPAYWPAKICRVKETAKEKQTVPKGATDQPVIGLSVRAKPSFAKDSPVLGYLPHGARFTVLQRDKQWVKIKRVIEKAIVPPSTAQTEVPAAAHSGWVSMSWLEARGQAPEDFDVVVTPASPPAVKAGELLGHMGEYRRVQDPGQSRRLMHHEIIVGPELRAFLEKSRAAAAKATPQQKTLLRVAPDAQLHNPVLAPPQAGLLPVDTIVALDGTPPDDALYVKVKPTAAMQWIDRKAKLPTGAKEANLFRLNDGAVYTAADIVRVPRQGAVGQPGATRFRGVFVGAASQTPVWITKDAYTALVSVQGGKLLTADLAQGWVSFPLTFAANGPKNGAQPQHVSRLMLQQSRPDKQIPTELPKVFALDEAGNAWWQVRLKTVGTTAIGWVGEAGHAGVSLHSPYEWVDFKLIESKPITAAYGSYFADFKQMEEFQRGRLGLKDADLDVPLREVRALLDANHDGQLTLAEVKAAQRDRDTIYQLSRVILRYPSEWKADKKAWDAYDALIPPSSKMVWESEKTRIVQLVWWENVAGKAKDFPVDPSVFHIHPVSLVEIFNWPDFDEWMYMARTLYGEARGQNFESKVAVAWIIRNRLERGTWGDTYKDVVTARLQFTCWSERIDPDGYKAIHNPQGDPWKDCKKAALKVMLARDEENVFPGATHYYSPRAQAQLHAKNPTLYPNTPLFAVPEKRVKNPEGVSDEDYQFYRM
ncbi:cell wall hydrolase [Burkholderia cepacia]|uniref:cell wall hydrolase n=2 Tax=Burkholderia cepacia TaxID=292 RepID=UPI002FE0A3E4